MLIRELPQHIQYIVAARQAEAGNSKHLDIDLTAGRSEGNFYFRETPEGHRMWHQVDEGNYDDFNQFHGIRPQEEVPTKPLKWANTDWVAKGDYNALSALYNDLKNRGFVNVEDLQQEVKYYNRYLLVPCLGDANYDGRRFYSLSQGRDDAWTFDINTQWDYDNLIQYAVFGREIPQPVPQDQESEQSQQRLAWRQRDWKAFGSYHRLMLLVERLKSFGFWTHENPEYEIGTMNRHLLVPSQNTDNPDSYSKFFFLTYGRETAILYDINVDAGFENLIRYIVPEDQQSNGCESGAMEASDESADEYSPNSHVVGSLSEGEWIFIERDSNHDQDALVKFTRNQFTAGFNFGGDWTANEFNLKTVLFSGYRIRRASKPEIKQRLQNYWIYIAGSLDSPVMGYLASAGAHNPLNLNRHEFDHAYNEVDDTLWGSQGRIYYQGRWETPAGENDAYPNKWTLNNRQVVINKDTEMFEWDGSFFHKNTIYELAQMASRPGVQVRIEFNNATLEERQLKQLTEDFDNDRIVQSQRQHN